MNHSLNHPPREAVHYVTVHSTLSFWGLPASESRQTQHRFHCNIPHIYHGISSKNQRWTNTRYRNGHNIVPGTIPIGTLLYHGTGKQEIPSSPEWTAIDPEHSYMYCFFKPEDFMGCWHLTLITNRPLKVLYFDGNSAAKFPGGSMDSQDALSWGEIKPDWTFEERKRLDSLCEWGKKYGIDGFVRMEMGFEVMLCDFSAGVDVVSFHNLAGRDLESERRNISDPLKSPPIFRTIEAGSWHNHYPGETRIHLNYAGVVSFYDTALFPSLVPLRYNKERWDHRLEGISSEDVETFLKALGSVLEGAWDCPVSGIDWKTLLRVVVDRYVVRLQKLNRLLNSTVLDPEADPTLALKKAHNHLAAMLSPYRLFHASPPEIHSIPKLSWAIPVFEECSTTHTRYIESNPSLSQTLTYSEHLLLNSTKSVSKEICRVIVRMWAEGMEHPIAKEGFARFESAQELITRWKVLTEELIAWLDWSEWITCQPACGVEEICYLPTWPFFTSGPVVMPDSLPPPERYHLFNWSLRPLVVHDGLPPPDLRPWRSNSEGDDDSVKPQPRCIQRIEFQSIEV